MHSSPQKKTLQKQSVLNLSSIYFPIVVKLYKNMTYDSYMLIWSTLIHVPAAPELQNLTKTCIRLHTCFCMILMLIPCTYMLENRGYTGYRPFSASKSGQSVRKYSHKPPYVKISIFSKMSVTCFCQITLASG